MKFRILLSVIIVLAVLLTSCGSNQATSVPVTSTQRPIVKVATAQLTAAPTAMLEPGRITGSAYLMAPPTPPLVVYAVDQATSKWVSIQTEQSDGPASFTLQVPPGTYQIFAAVVDGHNVHLGYTQDGLTLAKVIVAAGQTVANIEVSPPSQNECGSMMGYPASPDGRFAATAGPSKDCLATQSASNSDTSQQVGKGVYQPLEPAMCQTIQDMAQQALGVNFTMEAQAPFLDPISSEAGQGCRLTATGTGKQFTSPSAAVEALVSQSGFTEQPNYQADGPTGSATAAVRDMALMLISANWSPEASVQCPADKPISDCALTPEQKIYTIQIDTAIFPANFTLTGHWEDATTGLSLDLSQEWKNVFGHHLIATQGGNKIDTLDATTITGTLQGNVATVQFQSSFASDLGTAQITYVDVNTIHWQITTPPNGEYYLPAETTLTRK